MALDPRQQIVTVMASSVDAAIHTLLGFIDDGPGARIVSISLATTVPYVKDGGGHSTAALALVAVLELAVAPPPGQVPPAITIRSPF